MNLKITSWNVNGLRACVKKGFSDWLEADKNHIICLQETKLQEEQIPIEVKEHKKYESYFSHAKKKGYSGVAVLCKKTHLPLKVTEGLGQKKFDDEGRTLILEFDSFILFCCYFPNGQRDHNRVPYKLSYSKAVAKKALELKEKTKKEIIITGDYNTAHHPIDLKNPKTNTKTTGFLPIERKWMDDFIKQGFNDVFRLKHPEEENHYTWWTYRGDCRKRNIGWRIDYFFTTKDLVQKVKKSYHQPEVLGSDHCPITIELKL